jgi:hypothetical protein
MATQRERESIAAVVRLGLTEIEGNRLSNARGQLALADRMIMEAQGGRPVKLATLADANGSDPRFSVSLETGLAVLALFTPERPVWGIAEIAHALGRSRSTVHRYCATLVRCGQLTQDGVGGRKYSVVQSH